MRGARIALSALAVPALALIGPTASGAAARASSAAAPLTMESQTPWVQATAPWFSLTLAVGERSIPVGQLRVSLTFYGRIGDASELQQAITGTPQDNVLQHFTDVPVTNSAGGRTATTCVTVIPDSTVVPPAPTPASGGCIVGGPTVVLQCSQSDETCGDVYPVSVALVRQGSGSVLSRFTTFLTYEQPAAVGGTGPLRVGWVVPVGGAGMSALADDLTDHHQVPTTLEVSPRAVAGLDAHAGRSSDRHTLAQLQALTVPGGDQLLSQPYVPVSLAALEQAGIGGEIASQLGRGDQLLRAGGLHPSDGTWVDVDANLANANAGSLASGLQAAQAGTVVVNDTDLAGGASPRLTFAHPFSLQLTRTAHPAALAADSTLDGRFTAEPGDPVLAANQLLAGLSFVHFEDAFLTDPRGVVLVPPANWRAADAFVGTLLSGLAGNPALKPVTLDQLAAEVHGGSGDDPAPGVRKLQTGAASTGGFTKGTVRRIIAARQHLASFFGPHGAVTGHPPVLSALSDALLGAEGARLNAGGRSAALSAYDRQFGRLLSSVSLATESTITFTASTAAIPITVLSSAPYPVRVVLTVQSDKFTFPGGASRTLVLDRPTTPVRVQADARTSGDRLPVAVTLRTPDGQLLIARVIVSIHSTAISVVGIALTVVALLVLLMWWGRTWRRSRRHRPRAH